MLEAIDVLKGVLGFEEVSASSRARSRDAPPLSSIVDDRPQSPPTSFKPPPPPLPNRPESRTHGSTSGTSESRKGRPPPPLPSIASASIINRRRDSSAHRSDDAQTTLDDEDNAFADPVIRHERRTSSPSNRFNRPTSTFSQGNTGSPDQATHDIQNRNRSASDPFADTNGHLNFGYGNRRSRTQGSLGTLAEPGPSPSMMPLLANEGSSVGTTSYSILGKASLGTGGELKKTVPLPQSEDFELDLAGPSRGMGTQGSTIAAVAPESDEDEGTELFHEPERSSNRASGFSFGMIGRGRRGSETTGLGLVGPGLDPPPSKASLLTRSPMSPPETPRPLKNGVFSLATPPRPDPNTLHATDSYASVDDEPHLRTWTVPAYLGNPEIAQLLAAFPTTISGGSVPRFKGSVNNKSKERQSASVRSRRAPEELDLEAQEYEEQPADDKEWLRYGTGRMCLTESERDDGWMGSMWERLKNWWRRVFC